MPKRPSITMMEKSAFENQNAIVTGSTLGLGEATARLLAKRGLAGIVITVTPILVAYAVGAWLLKLHPAILMGALTGAMTSGASLSVVTTEAKSAIPAIGYASTYAFGNVLLMIAGPILLMLT